MHDIGIERLGFPELRTEGTLERYGFPAPSPPDRRTPDGSGGPSRPGKDTSNSKQSGATAGSTKDRAHSSLDPRSVKRRLRTMVIRGQNREKVVDLRNEASLLNLNKTPIAFCFLLRAMFELSARAYYGDNKASGLVRVGPDGKEKRLVEQLKEVAKHLQEKAKASMDTDTAGAIRVAASELSRPHSLLSVRSMHDIVHSQHFSLQASEISQNYHRVAALLEAMNA